MKREILFKAKRVDNGEWVEGCLINWHYKLNPRIIWFKQSDVSEDNDGLIETNFEVHPETVCQFIKDGFFENDIVERIEYKCNGEETIGKYQIVWDEKEFRWALKTIKSIVFRKNAIVGFNGELTKVGNIHDK